MLRIIIMKSVSSIVRYEKLKLENHYFEMLTATVSHDMRTPLNSVISLLRNLKPCI